MNAIDVRLVPTQNVKTSPKKPSLPKRLCKRVASFAASIFKGIKSFFRAIRPFKAKKIQPKRHVFTAATQPPRTPGVPNTPIRNSPARTPNGRRSAQRTLNFDEPVVPRVPAIPQPPAPPPVVRSPQAQEVHDLILELCTKESNNIYTNMVSPKLAEVQNFAPNLIPKLTSVINFLIDSDDVSSKASIKSLQEMDETTVTAAVDRRLTTFLASDSFKAMTADAGNERTAKIQLEDDMRDYIVNYFKKDTEQGRYQPSEQEVLAFIEWFFNNRANRRPLLSNFANAIPLAQSAFRTMPQLGMIFLTEKKTQYSKKIAEKIDEKLLDITQPGKLATISEETTAKVVEVVANLVSDRIMELTTSLSFEDTFDSILRNVISDGVTAQIIAADEVKSNEVDLAATKKQILKLHDQIEALETDITTANHILDDPLSKEHKKAGKTKIEKEKLLEKAKQELEKCVELINEVDEHLGEANYLEHSYLDKFASSAACDPIIKELTSRYIILRKQGIDPSAVVKSTERAIYSSLAEQFLPLILTPQKIEDANGESKEVEFFDYIVEKMAFPEELDEIKELVFSLGSEFTTPEVMNLLQRVQEPVIEIIRSTVKTQVEKQLHQRVTLEIEEICQKIVDPEKLDKLLANIVLPFVDDILMQQFTRQLVQANGKDFTPLFYRYMAAKPEREAIALTRLQDNISFVLTKACSCQESKRFLEANKTKLIDTEISSTCKLIKDYHFEKGEEIIKKERIAEYFAKPEPVVEVNEDLGKLANKFIFKVGQWKGKGTSIPSSKAESDLS